LQQVKVVRRGGEVIHRAQVVEEEDQQRQHVGVGVAPAPEERLRHHPAEVEDGAPQRPHGCARVRRHSSRAWATRSRWYTASPRVVSPHLARLKYRCMSCSQVKPMPPWTWMASPVTL